MYSARLHTGSVQGNMLRNIFVNLGERYQIDLRITLLVYFFEYDTSGCSSQGISWLPGYGYLNRSMLASTMLCNDLLSMLMTVDGGRDLYTNVQSSGTYRKHALCRESEAEER